MKEQILLKYRAPIVGWIFILIWLGMLLLFTYLFMRDGGFNQFSYEIEIGILGLFYMFSLGGASHFLSFPIIDIIKENNQIKIKKFKPFKSQTEILDNNQFELRIVKEIASEGENYSCVIRRNDKEDIIFASLSDENEAKKAIEDLKQKLI